MSHSQPPRRGNRSGSHAYTGWIALGLAPIAGLGVIALLPGQSEAQSASVETVSAESASAAPAFAPDTARADPGSAASVSASTRSPAALSAPAETERALFPRCSGPVRVTCVVDGDTIWYRGTKIRIADIDTPEISQPGCPQERALGERASERLRELLNAGSFGLDLPPDGRSEDRYGRALRVVTRNGESLGEVLVREGLAARWGGGKPRWC
jgi:endonuclease YncB( thermonuclease family)